MGLYGVKITGGWAGAIDEVAFGTSEEEAGKKVARSWNSRGNTRSYRVDTVTKLDFIVTWLHGTNTEKGGVHPNYKAFSEKEKAETFYNKLVGLKAEGKTYMAGTVVEVMKNF